MRGLKERFPDCAYDRGNLFVSTRGWTMLPTLSQDEMMMWQVMCHHVNLSECGIVFGSCAISADRGVRFRNLGLEAFLAKIPR